MAAYGAAGGALLEGAIAYPKLWTIFLGVIGAGGATVATEEDAVGTLQPAIIDTDVLVPASRGNPQALATIRAGDPRVTFSQLQEFLNVNTEVQQTQRAQFLLDEGVQFVNPQLDTPELRDAFAQIAQLRGEGDATLVTYGLQTGMQVARERGPQWLVLPRSD